ncbi:hypothetical protein TH25_18220 [Thalassospira profundimaris]|uniref:HutD-family protein n=1 Tax=Thalassospira profundimaris TaxID=502049 RepID=A0A367WXN8_9PROT|nr:HutD family protein [Thalassospira profundimaris]RCK45271.1 hypothetical protein TH25_18220 [Thalassospira profundimaris]
MNAPSAVRILRASDYRRMPWKNGGGETVEIAVFPANAGLDDFAWRISMATVASDGPFSSFPGIDRTLSILHGAGMTLVIGDKVPVTLTRDTEPYPFAADVATSALLVDGPITDLNVMTRRGHNTHRVTRHVVNGTQTLTTSEKAVTVILVQDAVEIVEDSGESHELQPLDAMMCDPSVANLTLKTGKPATVYEIVLTS